jgi:hypothetical protein
MLKWIGKNHPDKGGDAEVFKRVMAQAQNAGIKVGQGKLRGGNRYASYSDKEVFAVHQQCVEGLALPGLTKKGREVYAEGKKETEEELTRRGLRIPSLEDYKAAEILDGMTKGYGRSGGMKPAGERVKIVLAPPRPPNPPPPPPPPREPESKPITGKKRKAGEGRMRGKGHFSKAEMTQAKALKEDLVKQKSLADGEEDTEATLLQHFADWRNYGLRYNALRATLNQNIETEMPHEDERVIITEIMDLLKENYNEITGRDLPEKEHIEVEKLFKDFKPTHRR